MKGIGGFKVTSFAKWKPGEVNREPTRTNQIPSGQDLSSFKTEGTSLHRGLLGEIGLFLFLFSNFSEGQIT